MIGGLLAGTVPRCALAQSSKDDVLRTPSPVAVLRARRAGVWESGFGEGFRKGAARLSYSAGAGFGTHAFGSKRRHDLAVTAVEVGWIATSVPNGDEWYRGNVEIVGELFGGLQWRPNRRYLFGFTPLIRYNFATGSRWVPFVNGGAGFSLTNIRGRDLTGRFQFNIQIGAGTHYFFGDDLAVTAQYRWLHLSNAGTRQPNNGTNTQMIVLGLTRFF